MTDTSTNGQMRGGVSGPFSEVGLTGLKHGKGKSSVDEELLRELTGEKGIRTIKEMRDNDPVVGAILFAIDKLIRQVKWRVDGEEVPDEDKEFLDECMNDMSHTWVDFISEVLSMLPFGWSYFEQVYKKR